MIRIIAKRYAKALVELSEEKKTVDKTKADLASFIAAVESQPAMQKLFSSPVFTPENKKAVIKELAGKLGHAADHAALRGASGGNRQHPVSQGCP